MTLVDDQTFAGIDFHEPVVLAFPAVRRFLVL